MKLDHILNKEQLDEERRRLDPKCWKGYKKQGTKMKGDTRVNNCVPESVTTESKKDTHCSDKCCGADVKREDCKCPADCPHCNCNDPKVAEGKSPHKKGTKKYKKHMAAMHAGMGESVTEATSPGMNMIHKIFDGLDDEQKTQIQRELTVKSRGISVPPVIPNLKTKNRHPNDKDIADMPLSQLQNLYSDVNEDDTDYPQVVNRNIDKKNVMDILRKFPAETKKMQMDGDVFAIYDTDLYMALFDYFSEDMPYGTQKGRDGDPVEWINDELDSLGLLDEIVENNELTFEDDDKFFETFGELGYSIDENDLFEAEYQGRKVKLNKPMQGDVKKFKVYVKDPKTGNVKKVNFGHGGSSVKGKAMKIRKNNPKARKSFRARHNCDNPGPKTKARYWSCRKW